MSEEYIENVGIEASIVGFQGLHKTEKQSGQVDEHGVVTDQIVFKVNTLTEAATYDFGSHPLGLYEISRSWTYDVPWYYVTVNYRGMLDEGTYDLDVSFSEEPIESHPNIVKIMKAYQGTLVEHDKVRFPRLLRQRGASGLLEGGATKKNPMFGMKTFLSVKGMIRHTFTADTAPDLSRIGKIVKHVNESGYDTPDEHDWMLLPPKAKKLKGGGYEITQEYLMSPRGGWPEEVYTFLIL